MFNAMRFYLVFAALAGAFAVALGAMGAHLVPAKFGLHWLNSWQTAVQYQFFHALAILGVVALSAHLCAFWCRLSLLAFTLGIVLFCGSIYTMVAMGDRSISMLTPVGGIAFLLGWLLLGVSVLAKRS